MRDQLHRPAVQRRKRVAPFMRRLVRSRTFPVLGAILLVFLLSSLGVLLFEYPDNQSFHSLWDAIWWTLVTAATVGYGDKVPLTTGGRFVAILVMLFGIGLLGMVTGRIASWLVEWKIKEGSGLVDQKKVKKHFVICGWKNKQNRAKHRKSATPYQPSHYMTQPFFPMDNRSLEFFSHLPIHLMPTAPKHTVHAFPKLIKFRMYCNNDRL